MQEYYMKLLNSWSFYLSILEKNQNDIPVLFLMSLVVIIILFIVIFMLWLKKRKQNRIMRNERDKIIEKTISYLNGIVKSLSRKTEEWKKKYDKLVVKKDVYMQNALSQIKDDIIAMYKEEVEVVMEQLNKEIDNLKDAVPTK